MPRRDIHSVYSMYEQEFAQFCVLVIFVLSTTLCIMIYPYETERQRRVFILPLDELCKLGNLEKVKNKINQGKFNGMMYHNIDDFNRGLIIACKHGHAEIANLMAKKGVLLPSYTTSMCIKYTKLHDDLIHVIVSKFYTN